MLKALLSRQTNSSGACVQVLKAAAEGRPLSRVLRPFLLIGSNR